jgi:hypothetical protein
MKAQKERGVLEGGMTEDPREDFSIFLTLIPQLVS